MTCMNGIHENWPLTKLSALEAEHSGCLFTHSTIGLDRPLRVAISDLDRSIGSSNVIGSPLKAAFWAITVSPA